MRLLELNHAQRGTLKQAHNPISVVTFTPPPLVIKPCPKPEWSVLCSLGPMLNQFALSATDRTSTDTDVHYIFLPCQYSTLSKGKGRPCGTFTFKREKERELCKTDQRSRRQKKNQILINYLHNFPNNFPVSVPNASYFQKFHYSGIPQYFQGFLMEINMCLRYFNQYNKVIQQICINIVMCQAGIRHLGYNSKENKTPSSQRVYRM